MKQTRYFVRRKYKKLTGVLSNVDADFLSGKVQCAENLHLFASLRFTGLPSTLAVQNVIFYISVLTALIFFTGWNELQ